MVGSSLSSLKTLPFLNDPFSLSPSPIVSLLPSTVLFRVAVLIESYIANQMASQMAQMNPGAAGTGMFQPGQDPDKMFLSEAENLEVVEHEYILEGVEDRVLAFL